MGNDPSTAYAKARTIGACKDWAGGCKCYQCMAYADIWKIPRQRDDTALEEIKRHLENI